MCVWFERQPVVSSGHRSAGNLNVLSCTGKRRHRAAKRLKHSLIFAPRYGWATIPGDCRRGESTETVSFCNHVIDGYWRRASRRLLRCSILICRWSCGRGGWEEWSVVKAFGRYAQTCFTLFGDRVKHWFTFNEPIVPIGRLFVRLPLSQCGGFLNVRPPWRTIPCWRTRPPCAARRALTVIGVVHESDAVYPRSQRPPMCKPHHADLLFNRSFS